MAKKDKLEDSTLDEFDGFLEDLNEQLNALPEAPEGLQDEEFEKEKKNATTPRLSIIPALQATVFPMSSPENIWFTMFALNICLMLSAFIR